MPHRPRPAQEVQSSTSAAQAEKRYLLVDADAAGVAVTALLRGRPLAGDELDRISFALTRGPEGDAMPLVWSIERRCWEEEDPK